MFSQPDVIEASRKFVCVRIDSYASEENQKIVRSHLNGSFANTAFGILAPDGKERLTRSGRGPRQALSGSSDYARALNAISSRYEPAGDFSEAALPEFPSFKLALNVAAADQRLLVLIAGTDEELAQADKRLRSLAWNGQVVGRFHFDLDATDQWNGPLSRKEDGGSGIYIVRPDAFGLEGEVLEKHPLDTPTATLLTSLTKANRAFGNTRKKNYSEHVAEGRRKGIRIEMAMPYGEDRDGDGEIDARGRNRRR